MSKKKPDALLSRPGMEVTVLSGIKWVGWPALICASAMLSEAAPASAQVFHDDFNGTALDPSVWALDPGDGQVVVANGVATLSCAGRMFPVVTSRHDPFPPGDFLVRVGMQYLSPAFCGDGFGSMDNFWEDYFGIACRPFLLWQDSGGLGIYCGSSGPTGLAPAPETGYHIYEWLYVNGEYQFSMDGVIRASGGCAPRATEIFFGHPHPIDCANWTSFAIDFIDISPVGVTPARGMTWGRVKQLYR